MKSTERWLQRLAPEAGEPLHVVARCGSFYHLLGLLALLEFLRGRGIAVGDVTVADDVFLGKSPLQRLRPVQEALGIRLEAFGTAQGARMPSLRQWFNLLGAGRKRILYCSPGGLPLSGLAAIAARYPDARLTWCRLEEGTGSYTDMRARRAALRRQAGAGAAAWARVLPALAWQSLLEKLFCQHAWFLFAADGTSFRPRAEVVAGYRAALGTLARATRYAPPDIAPGTVLFLSQPVVELGVCSREEYLAHIAGVRRRLAGDAPFRIKPHPYEDAEKFPSSERLADDMPVELLAASGAGRLACVAGLNSTALYTVPLLTGVPSVVCDGAPVRAFIGSAGAAAQAILRASVREWIDAEAAGDRP